MKRLNKLISVMLAILMVLSCSIDLSMLAVYADETPAKAEESVDSGDAADSEKDAAESETEEKSETDKGDPEKPANDNTASDKKENPGADSGKQDTDQKSGDSSAKAGIHEREIKARLVKEDLYLDDQAKKKTEANIGLTNFWKSLTGRILDLQGENTDVTVTVKGKLPDGVTAECRYIVLDEADEPVEQGLADLTVILYDKNGKLYVPEDDLEISVKGKLIRDEVKDDNALIVYSYLENAEREKDYTKKYKSMLAEMNADEFYAADVLVYESKGYDHARRLYEQYDKKESYKNGEDAVRYLRSGDLDTDKDLAGFVYDRDKYSNLTGSNDYKENGAIRFVIASQKEDSTEKNKESDGDGNKEDPIDNEESIKEDTEKPDESGEESDKEDSNDEEPAVKNPLVKGQILTVSNGKTYEVTVTCGEKSGIPDNAELRVSDVSGNFREYSSYLNEAAGKLGKDINSINFAYALDIKLVDPVSGEEYQPDADVKVEIRLLKEDVSENEDINVVHFIDDMDEETDEETDPSVSLDSGAAIKNEESEIINAHVNADGAVEFLSSGFSVYMILQAEGDVTEGNGILTKELTDLEGNWATWTITVNPDGEELSEENSLTLKDTFTNNQSIDYSSITVAGNDVTYDYSGRTGTFTIPDSTAVTISYSTRITAQPGERVEYGNTAILYNSSDVELDRVTCEEDDIIYPSASDVASTTGDYMVKAFVYADGQMQEGIPGAQFMLMDANQRIMYYKEGSHKDESITFTTGDNGYVDISLDEEECGVSIQKNTAYYLEMIKAPAGYKKDTTLYSFMITDDPGYESGDVWTYYNGDTMKMRLYPEGAGLSVSMRFSGNYALTEDQQNGVVVKLQKKNGATWNDIEEHDYSEFDHGSLTFEKGTADDPFTTGDTYRVIQKNQRPWDLDDSVILTSTYYLIRGQNDYPPKNEPQEFTVTDDNINNSVNIVINNEYELHELSITKMNKETGEKLSGAVFTVKTAKGDTEVASYTTNESGTIIISGGDDYESEVLYYVVETQAPAGYLLPVEPQKYYFYFCNDSDLEPSILEDLPKGETAVNLSKTYNSLSLDNQKEERNITVMKTWQGNTWPDGVNSVVIGLYQSVGGSDKTEVLDEHDQPLTVELNKTLPYNNTNFVHLPTRDSQNRTITYSIKEEHVYDSNSEDIINRYVQDYGISDSGVYIVKNSDAATLTVEKEWYDGNNNEVTNVNVLAEQQDVAFDIYRSTEKVFEGDSVEISNTEMESHLTSLTLVRSKVRLNNEDDWRKVISDLPKQDDLGKSYYYYVYEEVPSFGEETYVINQEDRRVLIKNKIAPEKVSVTVKKAVEDDPRPEADTKEFEFTLKLEKGTRPIREYTVFVQGDEKFKTNWDGEVQFKLRNSQEIALTLPVGVTATVTETDNPEYNATSTFDGTTGDSVISFDVTNGTDGKTVTFTNTLRVICNVVDKNGADHVFESFKRALEYVRDHTEDYTGTITIQMLEDYVMPEHDIFDVRSGENIVLTTASRTDDKFPFITERTGEDSDTAIITRGNSSGSMLTNSGTLKLDKIILDGAGRTYSSIEVDGGLVSSDGTLTIQTGSKLCNSSIAGKGGAVYSSGPITMPGGSITGNSASNGSAIYLNNCTLTMTGGEIKNNTVIVEEGGAVAFNNTVVEKDKVVPGTYSKINLSGDPVIFDNLNSSDDWANIYLDVDSDTIINVKAPGLGENAQIGVRAIDPHREIGEQFATTDFEMIDNLDRFVNDLYEYRGKIRDGSYTNVVWDGLELTLKKEFGNEAKGANENDRFTITLTSTSIRRSNYTINGSLDYTVTPTEQNIPGTIVFRNVKASDTDFITIYPLSVGSYTITEDDSNYTPAYKIRNTESGSNADSDIDDGKFTLQGDSTVTAINTRRLADVKLTKKLDDRLKGESETQEFEFTAELIDADGTPVKNFTLAEAGEGQEAVTTDADGKATFNMLPSNTHTVSREFEVPVGSTISIIETHDDNYDVTVSAVTAPSEGDPQQITDSDTENDDIFTFEVTDDGADVVFENERKMARIDLSKTLVGKVSAEENFNILVTLKRADGDPAANYLIYRDSEDSSKNIRTNENGQAIIPFSFGEDDNDPKNYLLVVPDGTSLEVSEEVVKKRVGTSDQEIYETKVVVNGEEKTPQTKTIGDKTYKSYLFEHVSDNDKSIAFTNTRKMQTITVTNTVNGYSGNVVPFTYNVSVTDGGEDDYDINGFTDGKQTFELTTGQSKDLIVPYGAECTITEGFIVGYDTTIKRGNTNLGTKLEDKFTVTADVVVAFTNAQLIGLRLVNNTSNTLNNVIVTVGYGTKIYRVNEDQTGQDKINNGTDKNATLSIGPGKTAILEISHQTSITAEQIYSVSGIAPAIGYYYTINNEPSFHEYADPAVLRVYNDDDFEVKGKLRYSVDDSIVTFSEQPLVSFDPNGGIWTTEMEGYHDRDGDRKVYQMAVDTDETVSRPDPDPVYPAGEIELLGWTKDKVFAEQSHTAADRGSDKLYNFNTPVTEPFTLYAVWLKDATDAHLVKVKNDTADSVTIDVTLTNNTDPIGGYTLYEDSDNPDNNITTDSNGSAALDLPFGAQKTITVPDDSKLVLADHDQSSIAYSPIYTDSDDLVSSFTIDTVRQDGSVSFITGVCKITNNNGDILYDADGKPAVYETLTNAFTAYSGTLYSDKNRTATAVPDAVKMLIDDYFIQETAAIAFPNKTMTLTTAGKNDDDFPYVGIRDRSTIYRTANEANVNCFTLASGNITLTDIILDGGSKQGVKIQKDKNGGLIYMNNASGTLNVSGGTTMRNAEFAAYDNANNSQGGAIYMTNGTLNVNTANDNERVLFTDLHAYQGGAICVTGGTLNVTSSTKEGIRFEKCYAETQDGGAIYYNNTKALTINGGADKDNPGIVFIGCEAKNTCNNDKNKDGGDGGAIFATTSSNYQMTVSGCSFTECSAKSWKSENAGRGGGAICANGVNTLQVSCCKFTNCDTMSRGGAIVAYVKNGGQISVQSSSFEKCNCKGQGGALAVYQPNQESGNPSAATKSTKLTIGDSYFSNCSSGTDNGSGGAIQCYLPCMDFSGTTFTDCWAGKEGGAVNNYFANGYTSMWDGSYLNLTECRFVRCRAEDRYDPTALQHYGGGLNTKVKTATVTNCTFEDCVSTIKEGGALHLGGQGSGSTSTITGTTFKNCMAKNGGGALLASAAELSISDSYFYGCSSSASNGGAVYHYRNSRGDSTQNVTSITGCTFSAENSGSESCSAANNGGAIWTRATTVTIHNSTIDGCTAGVSGGGVYLSKKSSQNATISAYSPDRDADTGNMTYKGVITNCEAPKGSAVYVEDKATFSDVCITGNIVSNINDGAIHGGSLYFEKNVTVKENTCSGDSTDDHDVLMQNDNLTTINTTTTGLLEYAQVGVYVPDENGRFNKYGQEGQKFGTHGTEDGNKYLDGFFNDRIVDLYGYQANDDGKIYWGCYLCKITDAEGNTLKRTNGRDAIYQRLTLAIGEFKEVDENNLADAVYIKMLVENYDIQQTAQIDNFPANTNITLTTETYTGKDPVTGEYDGKHPYRGTDGTVCTISRTNNSNQLFNLNSENATFQLKDITLDGRKDKTASRGDYRLIEVTKGSLIVNGGTTLQYGYSNNGGAICVSNETNTNLEIYSANNADVLFDHCVQDGNNTSDKNMGGGAINSKSTVKINNVQGGTIYFDNCSAMARGGAIMLHHLSNTGIDLEVTGAEFKYCYSGRGGGAIYHNNTNDNTKTTLDNCKFENCYSVGEYSYGGAVASKTAYLEVKNSCNFKNCYAEYNGGAINHGLDIADRTETKITDTTFENCETKGTDNAYGYGGSVSTYAIAVDVEKCTFTNSESSNHGGALYLQSNLDDSEVTISGTTFDKCSTKRSDGCGGAIYTNGNTLTINNKESVKSKIQNCTAPDKSGAIYMAKVGGTINITDSTLISGCYANLGGAIYLKNSAIINISGKPEFTKNGYTTDGLNAQAGACIYLEEGSRINLQGSPKFSRNNITNVPRIINGGITDYVRQDLYLAGYDGISAESIHVSGKLTGDTIWVWPENAPHRTPGDQFAKTEGQDTVDKNSLNLFRNALPDDQTGCSNGEYLAGERLTGHPDNMVYWSKMYTVSFLKKDNKAVGVAGAEFTLYTDDTCEESAEYAKKKSADTEQEHDDVGNYLVKGTVNFTSIPIGVYYMKETVVPISYEGDTDTTYIVLVGTPSLKRTEGYNEYLWDDGPLHVDNAETLVQRNTISAGKYYGIYPIGDDGKADVTKNLASSSVGIINTRIDYEAYFMKVDDHNAPLPNAAFTVYVQKTDEDGNPIYDNNYPVLKPWSRDGEYYPEPVKSADGTTKYKKLDGTTAEKGLVYFRELPAGEYFLKETSYPDRNGSNRKTYYIESDRVLRLVVYENETFTLEELNKNGDFVDCDKKPYGEKEYYAVDNIEAVCKLTDDEDNLLYEMGRDGQTYPAIYSSLEEGFDTHNLYTLSKAEVENTAPLKLKVLKDFTISEPIVLDNTPDLTFTTAELQARDKDRYVFITNRTTDTSRAEIKRSYQEATSGDANNVALITVQGGTKLTLENIKLNGQKSQYEGRAIHVKNGSTLSLEDHTEIKDFIQTASDNSTGEKAVKGGAVLMDSGTTLNIDGGDNRSVVFTNNEVRNDRYSDPTGSCGGAIAISKGCTVSIQNVRFTGNKASAAADNKGNGGAVSIPQDMDITFNNAVFNANSVDNNGGAIYAGSGSSVTLLNNTIQSNTASAGSAVFIKDNVELTVSGGHISDNRSGDVNGGAINGTNENDRFYFIGNPVIYNNYGAKDGDQSSQQKNVVLSEDSNSIINTKSAGLSSKAKIGVYVIDGENGKLFTDHGMADTPFGTFIETTNQLHLASFKNDRNAGLYGVRNEENADDHLIYWSRPEGVRRVILRKVGQSSYASLSGAKFKIHIGTANGPLWKGIDINGNEDVEVFESGDSGVFYAGDLNYGTYYIEETNAPAGYTKPDGKYFIVTVGENGVGYSVDGGKTFINEVEAKDA